jgi:HSP20 family protein
MAIQRWDPFRDLLQLQERVNRLFEESVARSGVQRGADPQGTTSWHPPVDLFEQGDRYVVRADLPGVESGAVDLQIEGSDLVLRGERRGDPLVPRESYLRLERPSGAFLLRMALPDSVERQGIQAAHRNGVLEVVLPKKKAELHGRFRVDVK